MAGRLTVITGCMSSGKTEELFRLLRRQMIAGRSYRIFKHTLDNRAGRKNVGSRIGTLMAAIPVDCSTDILEIATAHSPDIVAIEEAQFFDEEIVTVVMQLLDEDFNVYITGLSTDFRGEPFYPMPDLMALADTLVPLNAICKVCGEEATMTQRLLDGEPAPYNSELIMVGGDESYEARCRDHHEVPYRTVYWDDTEVIQNGR
jgi:thymidine kinase